MMSNQSESYPTWAIGLWISNDEALSYHKDVLVQQSDSIDELADSLRDWIVDEDYPLATHTSMYTDLLGWALQQVDWRNLAETYWEDKESENEADEDEDTERCDSCGDSIDEDDTLSYRPEYHVQLCDTCFRIRELS